MKKTTMTGSFGVCLLSILFLFNGCTSAPEKPKIYTVEIKDMKFVPADITVNKGDTVVWINKDLVVHDVTEEDSKAWSSGPIQSGGSWKMAVTDEANYYCSIHVVMKGKVELQ
ncbi:MAG: plastocyanin/azurin family copper-binding protein [Mucilaginibacter sp.]